ncbi:MAG: helix-turn-helix domain-containing protein [Muribaculaceae bacterium]
MIERKAGFKICTAGWQKVLINSTLHLITPGKLQVVSPAFMIQALDQSDDFEVLEVIEDVRMLFPTMRSVLPSLVPHIIEHPVVEVGNELIADLQKWTAEIANLRTSLEASPDATQTAIISKLIEVTTLKAVLHTFHQVYCLSPVTQSDGKAVSPFTLQFLLSVQQNFVEHRDVAWYASQANMSTGYFSRCIRQTIGRSPSHIIALYTVQMAKTLLDKSTKSIKEISQELGFPEQFTFRKYFKQHTGMSPTDYRKAANNGSI